MEHKTTRVAVIIGVSLSALAVLALGAQDKYTVKVPNGLAFSEFRGYEAGKLSPSVRTETLLQQSSPIL